ncbi:Hypothetical predicted protein [Mytilus galloprovincialis]|uniref:B box-type domain-containing protein n=1 Tax=Mytilus galloprovincialis TaxID=29158 RepID=A0A8B6DYG1_MYTGA|nr:Hypothetical predicted protein [Mytilus galloprovincialis]
MSVYKCYDCKKVLCKDCSTKHNDDTKLHHHLMQLMSDKFILNCKFSLKEFVTCKRTLTDIEYLPSGLLIVAVERFPSELQICSVSGKQKHAIYLNNYPRKIDVVDKNTVAVSLTNKSIAIVDIQQHHICGTAINLIQDSFIYIENQFYVANRLGIDVIDMSGDVKRRIDLSFTPYDMCYDVDSQRIYCMDSSKLICIDRDGNDIFTLVDPNWTELRDLTIDNEGNVLVLQRNAGRGLGCVIKVDPNGKSNEVLITNIHLPMFTSTRISFHRLTNSVVIGVDDTVYIYKKK